MQLTNQQNKILKGISSWLHNTDEQVCILGGFAGTGKTTLIQEIVENPSLRFSSVPICCAPTGKAASVLQSKLSAEHRVCTIHSIIYQPIPPAEDTLMWLEDALLKDADNLEIQKAIIDERKLLAGKKLHFSVKGKQLASRDLIIVDECSMVSRKMRKDLMATGARILFVGDPGQLPPVRDKGFFELQQADFLLTEVHRQAAENPITRLCTDLRLGNDIPGKFHWSGGDGICKRIDKQDMEFNDWLTFDQVITGKNDTRRNINRFFRKRKGYQSIFPETGEKIICLRNNFIGTSRFINGVMGLAVSDAEISKHSQDLNCKILYEGSVRDVSLYQVPFRQHYQKDVVELSWMEREGLEEFDFGYAITVHKAQGSEWDCVLIADDGFNAGQKDFRRRWLYTAITRAKKELVWVQ